MNYQLFGHDEEYLQSVLGEPVRVTDVQEFDGAPMQTVFFYKKSYGFLLIWFDADHKIFKLQMYSKDIDKIELCFNQKKGLSKHSTIYVQYLTSYISRHVRSQENYCIGNIVRSPATF